MPDSRLQQNNVNTGQTEYPRIVCRYCTNKAERAKRCSLAFFLCVCRLDATSLWRKFIAKLSAVTLTKMISDDNGKPRVNLAITNNPKGGLLRGVAVSTACVIILRKPATQA